MCIYQVYSKLTVGKMCWISNYLVVSIISLTLEVLTGLLKTGHN